MSSTGIPSTDIASLIFFRIGVTKNSITVNTQVLCIDFVIVGFLQDS